MEQSLGSKYLILLSVLIVQTVTLTIKDQEAKPLIERPFRTVRFYENSIFFTLKDGSAFGFLDFSNKGKVESIYHLDEGQTLFDDFQTRQGLVIGNRNKSLIYFEPQNRTLRFDDQFVEEDFAELHGFMSINDRAYVATEDTIRYYFQYEEGVWKFEKTLMNQKTLNEGVQEEYVEFHFWPTQKLSERIFIITRAAFNKPGEEEKKLICYKWFVGEEQSVDGTCSYEKVLEFEEFRITGGWAYMRIGGLTYVYDRSFGMKTRWENEATQFVAGHASTADHMTYLFKSNELAYYRQLENFRNDDFKMTVTGKSLNVLRQNKKFVKLNKPDMADPIAGWVQEIDENSVRLLVQYDTADLHMFRVTRGDASTEISFLFKHHPVNPIKSRAQKQAEAAAAVEANAQDTTDLDQAEDLPQGSEKKQSAEQESSSKEEVKAAESIDPVPVEGEL